MRLMLNKPSSLAIKLNPGENLLGELKITQDPSGLKTFQFSTHNNKHKQAVY